MTDRYTLADGRDVAIDWAWVRGRVARLERITAPGTAGHKPEIAAAMDDCLRVARHLAMPKIASSGKRVLSIRGGSVKIEGGLSISAPSLASYIRGSEYLHLFLVSIGSDLEDTATMLMESGEQLHGYLLDRIGSLAAESLAEGFEKKLRKIYEKKKMAVSMRFSPGYCDWPIEEQADLDKAVRFSRAGVRLTESCMMIPRKSISGIVGVGPKGLFKKNSSQCDICAQKECSYRR
jgi:hypothetical protein